ncbi:MAG: hypothetical protein FJ096_00270 [Deltaproteobacteria bacterium]|nr:hypothetical protein [Deltaproteobacteria bacterium]
MTTSLLRRLLVAALAALALAGCERPIECTSEVTDGSTSKRASVRGAIGEAEPGVRRRALGAACEKLCEGRTVGGCVARCQIDVDVGKLGGRTRCSR